MVKSLFSLPANTIPAASREKCVLFCRSGVLLRQTDPLSPEATRSSNAPPVVCDVWYNANVHATHTCGCILWGNCECSNVPSGRLTGGMHDPVHGV